MVSRASLCRVYREGVEVASLISVGVNSVSEVATLLSDLRDRFPGCTYVLRWPLSADEVSAVLDTRRPDNG